MASYSPEEISFYQSPASPYLTSKSENFDKYGVFIERALSLLKATGRLGVIVPHKFMSIQSGGILRGLLTAKAHLEELIHFGTKKVFGKTVSNYTCILVMDRKGPTKTKIEQVSNLESWRYGQTGVVTEVPVTALTGDPWQFASAEAAALLGKVRQQFPTKLADVADIFVGLQTSADDIYIFKSASETANAVSLDWNGKKWSIEKGILRPFFLKVQFEPYERPTPNAWIIFPYVTEEVGGVKRARLLTPAEMNAAYPECLKYLEARRVELDKRKVSGGKKDEIQFYQFGRSQSLTLFETPKIILPALSLSARYGYDKANGLVTGGGNGPYYLLRANGNASVSDLFLLALLNHPLSEGFVRTKTSAFGGGYYSHGKQFIEELPVPIPTDDERHAIEALVTQLFDAQDSVGAAGNPHDRTLAQRQVADLQHQIEALISSLFKISADEFELARAIPIPE